MVSPDQNKSPKKILGGRLARGHIVVRLAPMEQHQLLPLLGDDLLQDVSVGRHLRHAQPIHDGMVPLPLEDEEDTLVGEGAKFLVVHARRRWDAASDVEVYADAAACGLQLPRRRMEDDAGRGGRGGGHLSERAVGARARRDGDGGGAVVRDAGVVAGSARRVVDAALPVDLALGFLSPAAGCARVRLAEDPDAHLRLVPREEPVLEPRRVVAVFGRLLDPPPSRLRRSPHAAEAPSVELAHEAAEDDAPEVPGKDLGGE